MASLLTDIIRDVPEQARACRSIGIMPESTKPIEISMQY